MPRVSPIQTNFNSGEFSPLLQGRADTERYKSGLGTCFNTIPTLQGPAIRRSGSRFVAATKMAGDKIILVPFKYSNTQSYILEFGDQYIRFYTSRAQLISGMAAYEIATFITKAMLPQLKWTQSLDVLYLTHPSFHPMKLLRHGATDWTIQFIEFKDGPYLNEGLPPAVVSVTSLIHVPQVRVTLFAANVYTVSTVAGDYAALAIANITNNGSGDCRVTFVDPDEFADRSQIYLYGVTGTTNANGTHLAKKITNLTYDLPGVAFNAAYTGGGKVAPAPFVLSDVGRLIRIKPSGVAWGYGQIFSYANGSQITVVQINPFAGVPFDTPRFALGAWSTSTGYPSCCTFHDDRLYFGGPLQRVDGSNTSDYENFAPSELDATGTIVGSNAVSFLINSNDANNILWMTSDEYGMPIGTAGGPFVMRASSLNEAITPTNVSVKRIDSIGAADAMAALCGKSSIYLSISTRKLFEVTYYYNIDGFRRVDLTEIAENLPDLGLSTNIVFQSSPQPIIWVGRADGTFLGMTFDRNLDTLRTGWSRHVLGGVSDSAGTPPVIESFAVIPSPDGTTDDVWFIVKRYINGQTVRYVEYLDKIFEDFDDYEDYLGSDSGATFDDPKTVLGITAANPGVVHVTAHGFTTGNTVRFKNVSGLKSNTHEDKINDITFTITVVDANHFSLNGFDSTNLTAYISGGEVRKQVTSISGLTWLKGETVSVLGNAKDLGDYVVDNAGAITLTEPAGTVQIGLPYEQKLQQLRLEAGSADGTSLGKNRRINETAVMLNRSFDFEIGTDFENMTPVLVANNDDNYQQSDPLFTGILGRIQVESNYDFQNQLAFRVKRPTPFTLVAIMPQQVTYDKN